MARRIRSTAFQAEEGRAGGSGHVDEYFDRVIKYIPSDVVGAWIVVTGFIPQGKDADPNSGTVLWLAFAVGVVLTAVWTWLQTREAGKPPATLQIAVSTIAFVVWVTALGRPINSIPGFLPYYGSLLLVAFTLISGRLVPKD